MHTSSFFFLAFVRVAIPKSFSFKSSILKVIQHFTDDNFLPHILNLNFSYLDDCYNKNVYSRNFSELNWASYQASFFFQSFFATTHKTLSFGAPHLLLFLFLFFFEDFIKSNNQQNNYNQLMQNLNITVMCKNFNFEFERLNDILLLSFAWEIYIFF